MLFFRAMRVIPYLRAVSKLFHSVGAIVLCGLPHWAKRCWSMTCMTSMNMLWHVATMAGVVNESWMNRSIVDWRVVVCQDGKVWAIIWSGLHKGSLLLFIMMNRGRHLLIRSNTRVE